MTKKDLQRLFQDLQEILKTFDYDTLIRRLQTLISKYEPKILQKKPKKVEQEQQAADEPSETIPHATSELMRQRDVLLKKCRAIADANVHVNAERSLDFKRMTSENSQLIAEMNQLRVEKGSYGRRLKEMETRLVQYERDASTGAGQGGGPSHSSSAPNLLPQSSMRSPEMRRQRNVGDAGSTPFMRRRMHADDEAAYRQRNKELNHLPPVDPSSPPEPKPSPGTRRRRDLARLSPSPAEKELQTVMSSMAAHTESMEQQGFQMERLREFSASVSGQSTSQRDVAASSTDDVSLTEVQSDLEASPAAKRSAKRRPR